jgi:site-specific DNA-methyltransferase (adenine-specific)
LEFHPICLLFPQLGKAELAELAADIKARGLLHAIILYQGQILDGRNRYIACGIAGVEPRFEEWHGTGSPLEWVISENLIRRHLTSSQRAVIAHDMLPMLEKEAKERQRLGNGLGKGDRVFKKLNTQSQNGAASKIAARFTRTNHTYVHAVKTITTDAPDLLDSIRSGTLTVPDAITLAKLSKAKRQKVLRRMEEAGPEQKIKRVIREAELDSLKRESANGTTSSHKGELQVWCGDCLSLLPQIKDKTISVVVTSPPYNLHVKYNGYADNMPFEKYLEWLEKVFAQVKRVLKDDGSFFLNAGCSRGKPWNAMKVAEVAGKHFVLQNEIVWVKAISIEGRSYGHFSPLASDRFLNHCHETVFHFSKTGSVKVDRLSIGVPFEDCSNLKRNSAPGNIRCGGDVWFIPYETIQGQGDKGNHPAVFPVELAARCIKLAGVRKNTVVLDPFLGTASTAAACQELGVRGIGIEIDAAYCKQAKKRLGLK